MTALPLATFANSQIDMLVRFQDPDDLDYYYEYNYYSDEYLLQLNAEAEQLKEASKVADQMVYMDCCGSLPRTHSWSKVVRLLLQGGAGSGYKKGSELSVEEKRAHLVRNVGGNNAEVCRPRQGGLVANSHP